MHVRVMHEQREEEEELLQVCKMAALSSFHAQVDQPM